MAQHVEPLLNIVLSKDFKNLVDSNGIPMIPSNDIYQQISDEMGNTISPKYIYVIQGNRYHLLNKILDFHGIEINTSLSESTLEITDDRSGIAKIFEFQLELPYKTWLTVMPEEVIYADKFRGEKNYQTLRRKLWTDKLFEVFHRETKLPCPPSFKRCKISESEYI